MAPPLSLGTNMVEHFWAESNFTVHLSPLTVLKMQFQLSNFVFWGSRGGEGWLYFSSFQASRFYRSHEWNFGSGAILIRIRKLWPAEMTQGGGRGVRYVCDPIKRYFLAPQQPHLAYFWHCRMEEWSANCFIKKSFLTLKSQGWAGKFLTRPGLAFYVRHCSSFFQSWI